ncbi:unnamed protein product [Echinostoma caproni]|uniref:ATP-dependent DNA helicase n=1 Tax=Echinostoma caproni TaxID=27848 RepID=A0A183AQK8_9TREM|nr:unnamed protein product [Echinostoma caproni]
MPDQDDVLATNSVDFRCTMCRFRCRLLQSNSMVNKNDLIQRMSQQNIYAITIGPARIRSRVPRESDTTQVPKALESASGTPNSAHGTILRKTPSNNGIEICSACLRQIRHSLRSLSTRSITEGIDPAVELMNRPEKFCIQKNLMSPITSDPTTRPRRCGQCENCFLFTCLSELCTVLQSYTSFTDPDEVSSHTKPGSEFISPVGGPLLLPLIGKNPKSSNDSLFSRSLPPAITLSTVSESVITTDNRPVCLCCQSSATPFLHRYQVSDDSNQVVCSGCLWAWLAQVNVAYHDPTVQRIARRLASAAAATGDCVPLLSSASRRTLVDTARLARLISQALPLWFVCPGCVTRRLHRLCSAQLPLNCPRWYRRRVQLACRSKSLEDLDPRLICLLSNPETDGAPNRMALVDVEYTNTVIERWLLPPEPPVIDECINRDQKNDAKQSSDESDTGTEDSFFSETSSGVSSDSSPLRIDTPDADYGADCWWEHGSEPADETIKMNDSPDMVIQDSDRGRKYSNEHEIEEEVPTDLVTSKRQRKLTPKAAEAMARLRRRPHPGTFASDNSIPEETNVSENGLTLGSELQDSSHQAKEIESPHEEAVESGTRVFQSNELQAIGAGDSGSKRFANDGPSPPASPRSETETQKSNRSHTGKRKASPPTEPVIRSKRSLKINPRFFNDYTGPFPCLVGEGRQIREPCVAEYGSEESDDNEDSGPSPRRLQDRRGLKPARLSGSSRGRFDSRTRRQSNTQQEGGYGSSQKPTGLGPRVKQVSRHALKSDADRYGSTISAMVHAARLAAVGAKIPGGTSPNHAALAATARSGTNLPSGDDHTPGLTCEDSEAHASFDLTEVSMRGSSRLSSKDSGRRLPLRCGQCAACIGLIQACGRCINCRVPDLLAIMVTKKGFSVEFINILDLILDQH